MNWKYLEDGIVPRSGQKVLISIFGGGEPVVKLATYHPKLVRTVWLCGDHVEYDEEGVYAWAELVKPCSWNSVEPYWINLPRLLPPEGLPVLASVAGDGALWTVTAEYVNGVWRSVTGGKYGTKDNSDIVYAWRYFPEAAGLRKVLA